MNILVTGGDGFIGVRLVEELKKRGHNVTIFREDIRDFENVNKQVKGQHVVYHLAALIDESLSREELFSVNVEGTKNILEACSRVGTHQFIYLSSSGVMGKFEGVANEKTPYNPQSTYEESKTEAEKLVLSYQEMIPVTVVRSVMVYGANKYWLKIIEQVKKGFPLLGSGENNVQFVYLKDLVSALVFLLGQEEDYGEIYVVAQEEPLKLKEVYEIIAKNLGIKLTGKNVPVWAAKIMGKIFEAKANFAGKKTILLPQYIERITRDRSYDITKIRTLGWKPRYSFEKGMREVFEEFRQKKQL